ncbi:MAG: RHS repeat-associated core domain-containing protein [Hyphomicrobium sp.]
MPTRIRAWHRHYDPTIGRYTQPDPIGFVDGPSVLAYAAGSPYVYVDKDGRRIWGINWGGTVAGFGGATAGMVLDTTVAGEEPRVSVMRGGSRI